MRPSLGGDFGGGLERPVNTVDVINWNTYHLFDHRAKLEEATPCGSPS
jgi:hypothetical protein